VKPPFRLHNVVSLVLPSFRCDESPVAWGRRDSVWRVLTVKLVMSGLALIWAERRLASARATSASRLW
jgi:hypothetical protein